jgi:hypothetical protein
MAASKKPALGIVCECDLFGNRQLAVAASWIDRFTVRNTLQLEVLSRAPQCPLLAHHAGDAIGLLAECPLLLPIELPVFQSPQLLIQPLPDTLVQCVTQYPSGGYAVKSYDATELRRDPLHYYSCSVRQHFGDAIHQFGGVVLGSHNRVGAEFSGMLQHQLERIGPRLLAQIGK